MASAAEPIARPRTQHRHASRGRSGVAARLAAAAERNSFPLLAVATLVALLVTRAVTTIVGDSWLLFAAGREISANGLPSHDALTVWSFGERWIDQQWAAQLLFYGLEAAIGVKGVVLFNAALVAASVAGAIGIAVATGASRRSASLVGLGATLVVLPHTAVRAQTLAYPLFVAVCALLVLERGRARGTRVLAVLPLLVIWGNLHGSVLVGAALVALYGLAHAYTRIRRRAGQHGWPTILTLVALPWVCVVASPYGLDLLDYYSATVGNRAFAALVGEWGPPVLPAQWPFFGLALAGTWLLARSRAADTFENPAFLLLLASALVAMRNIVWFTLLATIVLPRALDRVWPIGAGPERRAANRLLALSGAAVIAAASAAALARDPGAYAAHYSSSAASAVSRVAADSATRVFANERFGNWLIWRDKRLAGRVAFDARFELLSREELETIARWRGRSGLGWQRAARPYDVVVLDRSTERDVETALLARDFGVAHRSATVSVLVRKRR